MLIYSILPRPFLFHGEDKTHYSLGERVDCKNIPLGIIFREVDLSDIKLRIVLGKNLFLYFCVIDNLYVFLWKEIGRICLDMPLRNSYVFGLERKKSIISVCYFLLRFPNFLWPDH